MDSDDWYAAHGLAQPSSGAKIKLGEKLKKTLDELERARVEGLEAKAAADIAKIRRERNETERWLETIREHMVDQINEGRVPLKKIESYDRQDWIRSARSGKAKNQDLWETFRQFWRSEGLEPAVEEAHDGMGMKSWINLTVTVLPARPRGIENNGLKSDLGVGDYRG